MHTKNLFKRIISVTLAIAMVVGVLPFLGGELLKAIASEKIDTYDELVAALTPTPGEGQTASVDIVLGADIEITAPIDISAPGTYKISGGDDKYNLTASETLTGSMFTVGTDAVVTMSDLTFEDAKVDASLIFNNGTVIFDRVSVIDNEIQDNVITNGGKMYVNNSTFAGNESTAASAGSAENVAVISTYGTGEAYVLNTTITGNDKVGVKSAANTKTKLANSLIVSNFYTGTEKDLELAGSDDLIAYTVYGTLTGGATATKDNAVEQLDDKFMFNAYRKDTGKPLVYDGVVYLKRAAGVYKQYGTVTYFDYDDPSAVVAGFATYTEESGNHNVLITEAGDVDALASFKVDKYQTGATRTVQVGSEAAVGSAQFNEDRYYTLTILDPKNGTVEGATKKVYKENSFLTLTATADENYEFIRWVNETDKENRRVIGTNSTYSFAISGDVVISASFETLAGADVTLTLDGSTWADQKVELYQFGEVQVKSKLTYNSNTGKYEGTIYTGTYDVYVNEADSGYDLSVDKSGGHQLVKYANITYNANGGTGVVPNNKKVPIGTEIVLSDQAGLSKDEHTFTGWTIEGDRSGTVYAPGTDFLVEGGTNFLAYWKSIYADAEVIVKLNDVPNGSFTVKFKSLDSGKSFVAAYDSGMYTARLDNDDDYEILINDVAVGTLDTDKLNTQTFEYYIVTYDGNGNDDGQSNIEKTVLSGTPYELMNNNYTKTGYSFAGWNTTENGSGTTKQPSDPVLINGKTTFFAKWNAQNYLVTYDVNGGEPLPENLSTKYLDFGSRYGELPTPTRTGYNFSYWTLGDQAIYSTSNVATASNHTLVAKWEAKTYDVTAPQGLGLNFTVSSMSGVFTARHGDDFRFKLEPKDGYSVDNATVIVFDSSVAEPEKITLEAVDGIYTIPAIDADKTISVSGVEDTLAPALEIKISENKWNTFINEITFGKFFKATQNVIITAEDYGVGLAKVEYYVGEAMSFDELQAISEEDWKEIPTGDNFNIDPNKSLVVYARATDYNNNVSYACSEGLVLDDIAPVVKGVSADGLFDLDSEETYIAPLTIKATDEHLFKVVVNGIDREFDKNGEVVIAGSDIPIEIVVIDMAGNMTSNKVTVMSSTSVPDGEITDEVENTSDVETNLTTPPSELKDMFVTEDDEYAVDCGEDINILVKVNGEELVPEDDKETSVKEANNKGYTIAEYLDITLLKEYLTQGTNERIHETPKALTFVFDIPEEFINKDPDVVRTFYVGRVHGDDNEFTWLDDKDTDPKTVTIATDRFSTYVLAYKDVENEVTTQTAPTVDPDNPTANTDPNNNVTQPDATQPGAQDGATGEGDGTSDGGSSSGDREYLADTGDRTPILFTIGCLFVGCLGFVFFDKQRKKAKRESK